jgi:hypothetical protein
LRIRWIGKIERERSCTPFPKTLAQAMTVNYLVDMSHQHLESRGHIFANCASIAYLPTRLRYDPPAMIMIGEPPIMMLNLLRRCRSDAVADSYSINDALHLATTRQLYKITLVLQNVLLKSREEIGATSAIIS